ncbi:MAG: hypothetical protein ABII79_04485 [bacterium]
MKQVPSMIAITLLAVGLLLTALKSFGADEVMEKPEVGRYQLFQGTFTTLDAKNERADKEIAVFLLDTVTGKVMRYSTGIYKDGKYFERWVIAEE